MYKIKNNENPGIIIVERLNHGRLHVWHALHDAEVVARINDAWKRHGSPGHGYNMGTFEGCLAWNARCLSKQRIYRGSDISAAFLDYNDKRIADAAVSLGWAERV